MGAKSINANPTRSMSRFLREQNMQAGTSEANSELTKALYIHMRSVKPGQVRNQIRIKATTAHK